MTFTRKQLADAARYRIAGGTDLRRFGLEPYQVIQWEKDAIDRLIRRDLRLDQDIQTYTHEARQKLYNRAQLYLAPFNSLTVDAGVIDLTSAVEDYGMLIESIHPFGSVTHPEIAKPLVWTPSLESMSYPKTTVFAYYAIRGKYIVTRNTDGLFDSLGGEATVWAAKTPTIADFPKERREHLISTMIELFAESVNTMTVQSEVE